MEKKKPILMKISGLLLAMAVMFSNTNCWGAFGEPSLPNALKNKK